MTILDYFNSSENEASDEDSEEDGQADSRGNPPVEEYTAVPSKSLCRLVQRAVLSFI